MLCYVHTESWSGVSYSAHNSSVTNTLVSKCVSQPTECKSVGLLITVSDW